MSQPRVVVAGHLCLDILPALRPLTPEGLRALLQPGHMLEVGPAAFATGGAVANTGLALHRLGIPVRLMGKIGPDVFGKAVQEILSAFDPSLLDGILVDPGVQTSYTIILNPPGVDRIFLHSMGANADFGAGDIDPEKVRGADLFHFGYPPLMRRMFLNEGRELVEILKTVKNSGATTSLDLSLPDPDSESGRADWRRILKSCLPFTDLFLPSFTELLFMLRPGLYRSLIGENAAILDGATPGLLHEIGSELLEMGVKVVLIKLGERGLYLSTANQPEWIDFGRARPARIEAWAGLEMWKPAYQARAAGTTGAGDAAIAGFLAAFLRGWSPTEALSAAAALGACRVETAAALQNLPTWPDVQERIQAGWRQQPLQLEDPDWYWVTEEQVWSRQSPKSDRSSKIFS